MEQMEILTSYILPPIIVAASGFVLALLAYATSWVKRHTTNATVTGIVDRAVHDLSAVVAELAQQGDKLRDPVTGTLSAESAATLKTAAVDKFRSMWGEAGIRELTSVLGFDSPSFGTWLSAHIEKLVRTTPRALSSLAPPVLDVVAQVNTTK